MSVAGAIFAAMATAGIAYQFGAAWLARSALTGGGRTSDAAAVSILKPLHGAEPRLPENLGSFAAQDYPAPLQIVCGIQSPGDAAIAGVDAAQQAYPDADIALIVDGTRHGSNAKVSNLINLAAAARHDILVMSDSDMAVAPDYLSNVAAALAAPGVGAVTCLYHGRGDAGGWSRIAAMGISYGFLPSVIAGRALGLAAPCMGSTIALRRETLDRIGGFAAFADVLADDFAMGEAVRALGLTITVPRFSIAHGCAERSLGELVRHELRWNLTIRRIDPAGFIGSVLTNPLPLAVIALALGGTGSAAVVICVTSLASRIALALSIDRVTGTHTAPLWWLPARDLLSFVLYLSSFAVGTVDWRGSRLRVARDGGIVETPR